VEALETCPADNETYFFWSGQSLPKSAVGDWQRSLRKLFVLAGILDGHAHRFRDTFAVELLLAGCSFGACLDAAGTQKPEGYREALRALGQGPAGAVRGRREAKLGRRSDGARIAKGTPEVHEKAEAVN